MLPGITIGFSTSGSVSPRYSALLIMIFGYDALLARHLSSPCGQALSSDPGVMRNVTLSRLQDGHRATLLNVSKLGPKTKELGRQSLLSLRFSSNSN